ncbi:hypothetical protein XH93_34275 [Bradyrhizobium sp. CCBAU 51753]|nr:hypothetical protein XH93_34275 [Bradyrhizobium sp. CCBAU 51753]
MATIRQRGAKWQVQVRRSGARPLSKSFLRRKDAEAWARDMEVRANRSDLPADASILKTMRLTIPEVATISGHRDPTMLFRYAHANATSVFEKLNGGSDAKLKRAA